MIEHKNAKTSTILFLSILGLYGLFLVGSFCLTSIFLVNNSGITSAFIPTPTLDLACEDTSCLQVCLQRMPEFFVQPLSKNDEELLSNLGNVELIRYQWNERLSKLETIDKPNIPDYLKPYQENTELHYQIWDYVTALIPLGERLQVSNMRIVADRSPEAYAAAVGNSDPTWTLNVNILYFENPYAITSILAHEYAHMFTLTNTQAYIIPQRYVPRKTRDQFDKVSKKCNSFFMEEYCARQNSYLDKFGQRFWVGEVYESWVDTFLTIQKPGSNKNDEVEIFYFKFPNQFVSHYAATSPEEDIAESWQAFVMWPKPTGNTIADQKVLFFYEFPELVQQRKKIIQAVCKYAADHE